MNKKEISEIKKLFANENSVISTICGCYVDGDKNKKSMMREAFLSLPQDEMHKYMAIFRKCMTGTLGRNILNMEFADAATEVTVSQQKLMDLRDSELKDDAVLETFYDEIIANYNTADNYLILLVYGVYDVPAEPLTELRWRMHRTRYTDIYSAAYVLLSCPSRDFHITVSRMGFMREYVTG